jgi:DNA-binding transcriptional ArsR family regulator
VERGGRFGLVAAAGAILLLLASPAQADTENPVQATPEVDYGADAGAVLANVQAYDPSFAMTFTFERATLYELRLPAADLAGTRAQQVPTVLSVQRLARGEVGIDPAKGAMLLVLTDPQGLGAQLPVGAPRDPARFVVTVRDLASQLVDAGDVDPDLHHLHLGSDLAYTVQGLLLDEPVRATADGGLLVLFTDGGVRVLSGQNQNAQDLGRDALGQRALLLQAEGAHLVLEASGLTAVLQTPDAHLGAGGAVGGSVAGVPVGAQQHGGVRTSPDGLALVERGDLTGALLSGDALVGPSRSAGDQAKFAAPLDAQAAAAGLALGGAAALAALALAGLAAWGKHGLLALLAPLYARLQHDEVLDNGQREAIYRHVAESPGVNVSEVVKRFGLGWGATVYHLRVLERNHLIVAAKQGRQVCYFQNGGRYTGQMQGISVLRNANAALVARAILAHPGAQQRELCRLTQLAQPTVSWHLQRLEESGLVLSEGAPRKAYRASPSMEQLVQRGLVPGYAPQPAATARPSAAAPTTAMNA